MKQERVVKRILRDMKMSGLVSEENSAEVLILLNALWVACYEETIHKLQRRNTRKVNRVNREGVILARYDSITEAAKGVGFGMRYRGGCPIVLEVLSGRRKHTKEGYYFKYADDGKNENDG